MLSFERELAIIVRLDENVASRHCETNELGDLSPIALVESEFGWLEQSGISLDCALIIDDDDESLWARYIGYLIRWAINNNDPSCEGRKPLNYLSWCGQYTK